MTQHEMPLRKCRRKKRRGLLRGLLGALSGSPGNVGASTDVGSLARIASMLGLRSTEPNRMSENDVARVINYARKENPDALRQTVQEKPWFVKALGNPVVMGALTLAAAKLLSNRGKNA